MTARFKVCQAEKPLSSYFSRRFDALCRARLFFGKNEKNGTEKFA